MVNGLYAQGNKVLKSWPGSRLLKDRIQTYAVCYGETPDETASLFAAAPDLLAACIEADDLFAPHAFDGDGDSCGAICIRMIRAAIAKAKEPAR